MIMILIHAPKKDRVKPSYGMDQNFFARTVIFYGSICILIHH